MSIIHSGLPLFVKQNDFWHLGNAKRPDLLQLLAKSMLLDNLIIRSCAEALEEFAIEIQIEERSPAAITFYRDFLKSFIEYVGPEFQISNLATPKLRDYFVSLDPNHVHARHSRYRALRAFLNRCVK